MKIIDNITFPTEFLGYCCEFKGINENKTTTLKYEDSKGTVKGLLIYDITNSKVK